MLKELKSIPEPLQQMVLQKIGYGCIAHLISIFLLYWTMELYSVIAFVLMGLFFLGNASYLLDRSVNGKYLVINGFCCDVAYTSIRRHTKYIYIQTDEHTIKVLLKNRLKKIPIGSTVQLYIYPETTVDESDGMYRLFSYVALCVRSVKSYGKHK